VLDDAHDGKRDVLLTGRHEDPDQPQFTWTHRYTIRNGTYTYVGRTEPDRVQK